MNQSSLCFEKNKSIVFFNNGDIVSFIERRCGKAAAIENEFISVAMKKKKTEQQLLVN